MNYKKEVSHVEKTLAVCRCFAIGSGHECKCPCRSQKDAVDSPVPGEPLRRPGGEAVRSGRGKGDGRNGHRRDLSRGSGLQTQRGDQGGGERRDRIGYDHEHGMERHHPRDGSVCGALSHDPVRSHREGTRGVDRGKTFRADELERGPAPHVAVSDAHHGLHLE